MRLLLLSFIFCLSLWSSQAERLNSRILNFDHPEIHHFPNSHITSRDETIRISFTAFGTTFDLHLEPAVEVMSEAVFRNFDGEGNLLSSTPAPMIAFKGPNNARLTLMNLEEQTFSGFVDHEGEKYYFYPVAHEQMEDSLRAEMPSKMLVVKESDVVEDEDAPSYCGNRSPHEDEDEQLHSFSTRAYQAALSPSSLGYCPQTQKKVLVGIVTDPSYETRYGADSFAVALSTMNQLSDVYTREMNFQMALDSVNTGITNAVTNDCTVSATYNISTKLNEFKDWRSTGPFKDDPAGLYALFTNCYSSGTVGLAWVGTVCQKGYGTSVSSINPTSGWKIAAHEFGHNHNANHDNDPGGLMQSSISSSATGFSSQAQVSICGKYNQTKTNTVCWIDADCTPSCAGKTCGGDGCGSTCGTCTGGNICQSGTCVAPCVPNCSGKVCGPDGCGGTCSPGCSGGSCSSAGQCIAPPGTPDQDVFTSLINDKRAFYGNPPLVWNTALYSTVYDWTESCDWTYRASAKANILAWLGSVPDAATSMGSWLNQQNSWDCLTDGCSNRCYEFRTMIWHNTPSFACRNKVCQGTEGPTPTGQPNPWTYLVCAYEPTTSSGSPVPDITKCPNYCTPSSTCESLQYECGSFVDECGTTQTCATCPALVSECNTGTNKCDCIPLSCQPGDCGARDDGCSGTMQCGSCPTGQMCVSGGCVCAPERTCANQNLQCGSIADDGCGNRVECGTCPTGDTCESGVCQACVPTNSCALAGAVCGSVDTGCGTTPMECGVCPDGYTCEAGACICTQTCDNTDRTCGLYWNGCEELDCGACVEGYSCISGTCVTCQNCDLNADCVDLNCVCKAGFTGDGTSCTAVPDPTPNGTPGSWQVIEGSSSAWDFSGSALVQFPDNPHSTNEWLDVQGFPTSSGRTFSVLARRTIGNAKLGFAMAITSSFFYYLEWKTDGTSSGGEWELGYKRLGSNGAWTTTAFVFNSGGRPVRLTRSFPLDTWTQVTLKLDSSSLQLSYGNWRLTIGISITGPGLGLTSEGGAQFNNATFLSETNVVIALVSCTPEDVLRTQIAAALKVSESSIGPIQVECNKRQGGAAAVVSLYSVQGGPSSVALGSQLQSMIAAGHRSIAASGLQAYGASPSTVSFPPAGEVVTATPSTGSSGGSGGSGGSSGGSSGVGAGVIAPIVVVAVVVALIAGAALVNKGRKTSNAVEMTPVESRGGKTHQHGKRGDDNILYESPTSAPAPGTLPASSSAGTDANKPRTAVDVIGREEATSITARAPAHAVHDDDD